MSKSKDVILTRFIGKKSFIDKNGNPKPNIFVKRDNEAGLSMWDVTDFLQRNDENGVFKLGDKKVAKNPPYTIARCDLSKTGIDEIFKNTQSKFGNLNYKILHNFFSRHRDICFNTTGNPAAVHHIAQELLNASKFIKRPLNLK